MLAAQFPQQVQVTGNSAGVFEPHYMISNTSHSTLTDYKSAIGAK